MFLVVVGTGTVGVLWIHNHPEKKRILTEIDLFFKREKSFLFNQK